MLGFFKSHSQYEILNTEVTLEIYFIPFTDGETEN